MPVIGKEQIREYALTGNLRAILFWELKEVGLKDIEFEYCTTTLTLTLKNFPSTQELNERQLDLIWKMGWLNCRTESCNQTSEKAVRTYLHPGAPDASVAYKLLEAKSSYEKLKQRTIRSLELHANIFWKLDIKISTTEHIEYGYLEFFDVPNSGEFSKLSMEQLSALWQMGWSECTLIHRNGNRTYYSKD